MLAHLATTVIITTINFDTPGHASRTASLRWRDDVEFPSRLMTDCLMFGLVGPAEVASLYPTLLPRAPPLNSQDRLCCQRALTRGDRLLREVDGVTLVEKRRKHLAPTGVSMCRHHPLPRRKDVTMPGRVQGFPSPRLQTGSPKFSRCAVSG